MKTGLPASPFVLIDDARAGAGEGARLYRDPLDIVRADRLAEIEPALDRLREAKARGLHAAGFISYEAGYALESKLRGLDPRRREDDPPLLWFGLFEQGSPVDLSSIEVADGEGGEATPLVTRASYAEGFARVARHIIAGDIYQANFTFPCAVDVSCEPAIFYRAVRNRACAGHGALLHTGEHWLLSFSPEQFFSLENGMLTTRPMKGTALRDADPVKDAANARWLQEDTKQRAENLMIVDLLRNDLSRVAVPGSVDVPALFTIESYPTVHQMTSTVIAMLRPDLDAIDVLKAIFPCGSITGAPKIKAMEIIHSVESHPRGPYTGAIGVLESDGNASFNVAIRTICVKDGEKRGLIGLGSGLVADSAAASEWNECLDKGRFLQSGTARRGDDQR